MDSASGSPVGDFPTYRCNDGTLFNAESPCKELKDSDAWIKDNLEKEFLRMKSRQTYLYGVAYHMTGEESYLKLMRAGVEFIRNKGIDRKFGGAYTYWEKGKPDSLGFARTSQDLAYAEVGLAFYYYLTRDPDVLKDILYIKDFIFKNYRDDKNGFMLWAKEGEERGKQELVAALDQVNAYMLLLTPVLPAAGRLQADWKKELAFLVKGIRNRFYDPESALVWGAIDKPEYREIGGHHHNDFGHTIKSYWMMYLTARLLNDAELEKFALKNGQRVLNWAYLRSSGSWASRPDKDDTLDMGKDWWIYAELDQAAATFGLREPDYFRYLGRTYQFWFANQVDHSQKDVWHRIEPGSCGKDRPGEACWKPVFPKVHLWKNGYHVTEHALVGYLTTQAFRKEPATLYFAFKNGSADAKAAPYYFSAKKEQRSVESFKDIAGYKKVKVKFSGIY